MAGAFADSIYESFDELKPWVQTFTPVDMQHSIIAHLDPKNKERHKHYQNEREGKGKRKAENKTVSN